VRCAVEVQQAMAERNTGIGADDRIHSTRPSHSSRSAFHRSPSPRIWADNSRGI
jgi:hypothetical protein